MLKVGEDMEDIFDDGIDAEEMTLILGLADESLTQEERERLRMEKEQSLLEDDDFERDDEDIP